MNPLVSIIVPAYNAEKFIIDCLESIRKQDYDNFEIIVVDDVSTDRTKEVLTAYQKENNYEKVKIFYNDVNLGATQNCNVALSYCEGKYVCFFAGDDVMLPGKISAQVKMMEMDNSLSFCYHNVEVFDSDTDRTLYFTQSRGQSIFDVHDIIRLGGLPGANSVMARHECLPSGGYDTHLPKVSDWKMFIDLALRGDVGYISVCYARYRKHSGGLSSKANELLSEYHETLLYYETVIKSKKAVENSKLAWRRVLLGAIAREILEPRDWQYIDSVLRERPDISIRMLLFFSKMRVLTPLFKVIVSTYSKLR